jgi:hypothetical protein
MQKRNRGDGLLVVEQLDVGQARGVIDGNVDELPAGAVDLAVIAGFGPCGLARDAMADSNDAPELL